MEKVYDVVVRYHNDSIEEELNWPYIDASVVATFATKEVAEKFISLNYIYYLNKWDGFVDLKVNEKVLANTVTAVETDINKAKSFWVSADLNEKFDVIEINNIILDAEDNRKDLKEHAWVGRIDKKYSIFYKIPMSDIKTREEVMSFIKKRAEEEITDTL